MFDFVPVFQFCLLFCSEAVRRACLWGVQYPACMLAAKYGLLDWVRCKGRNHEAGMWAVRVPLSLRCASPTTHTAAEASCLCVVPFSAAVSGMAGYDLLPRPSRTQACTVLLTLKLNTLIWHHSCPQCAGFVYGGGSRSGVQLGLQTMGLVVTSLWSLAFALPVFLTLRALNALRVDQV